MIGHFINAVVSFLLVASAVFFFVVKSMNVLIARSHGGAPANYTSKKCPECSSEIPLGAKRCKYCTQPVV